MHIGRSHPDNNCLCSETWQQDDPVIDNYKKLKEICHNVTVFFGVENYGNVCKHIGTRTDHSYVKMWRRLSTKSPLEVFRD